MSNFLDDIYLNEFLKFDGGNYVNYKFKSLIILEGYNLWSIVSGDDCKPTASFYSRFGESRDERKGVVVNVHKGKYYSSHQRL